MASLSLGCGVLFVWSPCLSMLNSLESGLLLLENHQIQIEMSMGRCSKEMFPFKGDPAWSRTPVTFKEDPVWFRTPVSLEGDPVFETRVTSKGYSVLARTPVTSQGRHI